MNIKHFAFSLTALMVLFFGSCQDDLSDQGLSILGTDVSITIDSVPTLIPAQSVLEESYDARATTKLIGNINVPEYGKLNCSFISQLLSSTSMNIPDSITADQVDSLRMILTVPRGSLTGDSLAPQQLKVYRLNKQIDSSIQNNINPSDYYSKSDLLAKQSYTLSALSQSDSLFQELTTIDIPVKMPKKMAVDLFNQYREDPTMFQWPESFNKEFPGIYVEQNFGNGCIANISALQCFLYWNYDSLEYQYVDSTYQYVNVNLRDSVCLLSSTPEVVSSNIINYEVSDHIKDLVAQGKSVITTPGGYRVDVKFPAQDIIDKYKANNSTMTVISKLAMQVPGEAIENDYGIGVAPYLLMVKKSERDEFFANNKVPDGKTSFYAAYDSDTGMYYFDTMRDYIIDLINSGKTLTDDDVEFSLIPVLISTEDVTSYYTTTTYIVKCSNYIGKPTMTVLDTDNSIVVFTYSKQVIQ